MSTRLTTINNYNWNEDKLHDIILPLSTAKAHWAAIAFSSKPEEGELKNLLDILYSVQSDLSDIILELEEIEL